MIEMEIDILKRGSKIDYLTFKYDETIKRFKNTEAIEMEYFGKNEDKYHFGPIGNVIPTLFMTKSALLENVDDVYQKQILDQKQYKDVVFYIVKK